MGIFNLVNIIQNSNHAPSARRRNLVKRGEDDVPDLEQGDGANAGGLARLRGRCRAREKAGEGLEEETTVDAAGNDLPISVRDAARCKAIFDEAGLVNVICSEMKLRVGGGEGLMKPFKIMVIKLAFATLLLVLVAVAYFFLGSWDPGFGDCIAAARSFTGETLLLKSKTLRPEGTPCDDDDTTGCTHDTVFMEGTVDIYAAYETCNGYYWWNFCFVLFTVGLLFLRMITSLFPISLMTKMNQLMATATSEEPVRPYVLDRKILDLTIDCMRVAFVLYFSNRYGEKNKQHKSPFYIIPIN